MSKQGMTLQEWAAEIDRQSKAKRDLIASTASMRMNADSFEVFRKDSDQSEVFTMTDHFQRQLGSSLGIPAKYYDRMNEADPAFRANSVNFWLQRSDSRHMIRVLDGSGRAFLSDRYRRIDNDQIAESVLPILSGIAGARIESCAVTPSRMTLKVVNTRLEMEVRKGDVVQAGMIIVNSEIGESSLRVQPMVMRCICSNGMVIEEMGKRTYHVTREQEECWDLFSDNTRRADDEAFLLKLGDIVKTAVDETRFAMVVDKLREASQAKLPSAVPDVIELTQERFGLTKPETDSIWQHLIAGGDLTFYGLSNAITRASQDVEQYDRATDMERMGWSVITDRGWMR